MIDEKEVLAQRLKNYRKENKLNQYEFAKRCGISRALLSLIETQNDNITLDTIQLLASQMEITVSDLLNLSPVTYFVFPGKVKLDGETFTTYGIGILQDGIMGDCIPDISDDYDAIYSLVMLCNEEELDPIHLYDIAEDFVN